MKAVAEELDVPIESIDYCSLDGAESRTLRILEETLGWITAGLCTPHSLDLAIEDMAKLEWVAKRVVSAKDIVKFIRGHQKSLALYRSKANLELVLAGETRFATNFLSPWRAPR